MEYKIVEDKSNSYIIIPELRDLGLKHCFTTKTMDMGSHTNKSLKSLKENFRNIYDFLNIAPKILYSGYQVHSGNIELIQDLNQGEVNPFGRFIPKTDGLIANREGFALITRFADCTPIILYDPVKRVHANIHSGWRGTLEEIIKNGVEIMENQYESKVEDILAIIGPSIGQDDFEVDKDVMTEFENKFKSHKNIIREKSGGKYLIDLQKINKNILKTSGIMEDNITTIDISTYSNELFHSYRRDRENFGLMALITCL